MCLLVWFVTVPCVIPWPTSGVYCATRAVSVTAAPKASAAGTSCAGEGRRLSLNLDTKVALGPLPPGYAVTARPAPEVFVCYLDSYCGIPEWPPPHCVVIGAADQTV